MKKLNMRILAALLALLMFVNSCPTFAVATDPAGSNIPETTQATETPATEAPATEPPATDAAAVTQQNPCDTCGKDGCAGSHTNWCAICKKDDCGLTHVLCQICQGYDCGVTHVFCDICQRYDCGVTHRFCDICKMYDCIVEGHGETALADETEEPTDPAGSDGSGEPAAPADNCPWCEDTLGEDGAVIHSEICNAAYVYNGGADVGKYAKLSGDAISYGIDVSADPKTDKTGTQFFDTDFEDNTILRITGWYWDSDTTALWYRVGFYSGGAVAAAGWPASAWILQKYTDPDNDYGISLSLFSGCSVCGAPECEALHVFCESCKIYDCGVDHDAKEPDSVSEDGGSDHSADIGKYLKLNSAVSSFKVYNAENGNTLTYVHDDFTNDAIMRVADWKIDDQGLWYLVEFYKGGIVESSYTVDFPANPWFLQTDGTAANTFLFMQCCATCGLPDCDGNHETETVPSVSHPSGITVSSEDGIPAGAELSVSVPSVSTGAGSGIYDIKIMVPDENGNMVEWQPIDEGKTVTLSIPVNTSASYVDVYHYLDYLPAITQGTNVQYVSIEGAHEDGRAMLRDAIAASDREGYVAVQSNEKVPVTDGMLEVDVSSFSVFYFESGFYGDSDGNEDAINFSVGNKDNGKDYFVTRGTEIKYTATQFFSNWEYPSVFIKNDNYFTVTDEAELYHRYQIKHSPLVGNSTIYFTVMPTLTIKFESHLTDWEKFIEVPANISNIFMGNCPADQHNPAAGKYGAMNYTLPAATVKAGVEGYTFKNWYVKHSPAHTFAAGQTISLSDETLQVNWDENTDSYTVTLVADFEYVPHKVTYVDPLGFAEEKTEEYLYEEPYTVQNPSRTGYTFTGWTLSTTDPVEGWTDKFATGIVPGGSSVVNMYGDVTLTANWEETSGITYQVEHWFQNAMLNGYDISEQVDTLQGTTNDSTDAAKMVRSVVGFEVDSIENTTILGDGTAVAVIKYKRVESTIKFVDPQTGNILFTRKGVYGTAVPAYDRPTKENYVFMGWYTADYPDQFYTPTTFPATDMTLYAKWNLVKVTITFVDPLNNNNILYVINQEATTPVDKSKIPTPTKGGYTFTGWSPEVPATMPGTSMTVAAQWTPTPYVITFDANGGTLATTTETYTVEDNVEIPVPTRSGCTFNGWIVTSTDASAENWASSYAGNQNLAGMYGNVTLTANWSVGVTLSINNNGTIRVDGDALQGGTYNVRVGGFANSDVEFTPAAGYRITGVTVTVGGQEVATTFEPDGYTYHVGPDGVTERISIVVTTSNSLTVTFKSWNGTVLDTQNVTPGGAATAPTAPARKGHSFTGWDKVFDNVTTDLVVTAQYAVNSYTVTWVYGNGTEDATVEVQYGAAIVVPEDPEKVGHTFSGWSPEVPETMPAENQKFTAQWTVNQYPITWMDDAGNTLHTEQVPYGETPVYPDGTPTKVPAENDPYTYRFAGWTPEIQMVTGEATYTATYDALFDFKATIDRGTISYKDASVSKELERKDVVMGSDVDTQMVFEPEAGYQIKSVSINGVAQTVQLESDGSYIHTFENGMRAEEKLIEVVTEPIEVVINIQFTDGTNLLEIHVQKYSDVLLAITPKTGTTINAIELTGSESSETTNVTGVPNGYIYTATGIQESVTIVVNATSKDVFCAAASIDHGTVSIHCGNTTVTSKQSAEGNYISYDAAYTFTMTADGGRRVTRVDNTIFGEHTTEHSVGGVMNAHKVVLAQTEETVHNITYVLDNGSDDWQTTATYGSVVNLREAPVKSGYNFKGWWYDKDADSTVDGDELLAAGASFTMPNHGVTMTAQWLDSRLDSPHVVYVGINMSFYNSNGGWYYSLPQNEPAIIHGLVSVRAYKDTYETTTWNIQTKNIDGNKFTKHLPGAPSLYITEDVFKLESGYVNNLTNGGAEGIFDPTGAKTRACLKLSEADYQGIIQGWLDSSISYLKNEFDNTNLDWDAISKDAEDYTIIPYVVKRQNNGDNWFIDMVIQPSARYNITYKMNLENGYTSEVEEFTDNTGYGQGFQAKLANPKQATNENRPNAEPRFLGWWYDKNDNQIVEAAELYGAGELFTMPAKNVELVAQWEYPKRLKITETSGNASDTFFFDVVGTNGGKTVLSMTVSVQGGGYVIIDDIFAADYTVTEKNLWSWTYETGTNPITKSVAADATADTVFEFSKTKKNVCWLFDENHN